MSRKQEQPRWKRVLGGLFYTLFLAVVLLSATAAGWMKQSPLMTELFKQRIGISPRDPKEVFPSDTLTLLILGCDEDVMGTYSQAYRRQIAKEFEETGVRPHISRAIGRGKARTDMMLVMRLDFTRKTISGVSIPRDLQGRLPGYRPMKMNAFYSVAEKGQEKELTRAAVEALLPGVHIDRVVTVDYQAFQDLVDRVGGVPVSISKDMKYIDVAGGLFINLKKGTQVLDGYDAMGFVRFRHDDSDFERQKRQKEFLVALKQQIMSGSNFASLPLILEQSKAVLGDALSDSEIAGLAGFAQNVRPENIKFGMVPTIEQRRSTVLLLDERKLPQVLAESGLVPEYQANRSVGQ